MIIKFNNDDNLYDLYYQNESRFVTLSNKNNVSVPANTAGFFLIDDYDHNIILEDHSCHNIIFKKTNDSIIFANKMINYFVVFRYNTEGFVINYTIKRNNVLNKNEILYKEIIENEFSENFFIDIYDSDGFYNYKVENQEITNTNRDEKEIWLNKKEEQSFNSILNDKLEYINKTCNYYIVKGIDYNGEHFSYTLEDQNNIDNLLTLAQTSGGMDVPYHADGCDCKLYTADDIFAIYVSQKLNVTHHITYANQLKQYAKALNDLSLISEIEYGQNLTGIYLETYEKMMEQARAVTTVITSL